MDHCRECAAACRSCADECRRMSTQTRGPGKGRSAGMSARQ
jgi:hypothetical protein